GQSGKFSNGSTLQLQVHDPVDTPQPNDPTHAERNEIKQVAMKIRDTVHLQGILRPNRYLPDIKLRATPRSIHC
ncbi:MAG: hypothetical protein CL877_07300, partial [Dehalococcoidales bacterium]|nr:hypothetical protein [Dehalococcoidales bacterium]